MTAFGATFVRIWSEKSQIRVVHSNSRTELTMNRKSYFQTVLAALLERPLSEHSFQVNPIQDVSFQYRWESTLDNALFNCDAFWDSHWDSTKVPPQTGYTRIFGGHSEFCVLALLPCRTRSTRVNVFIDKRNPLLRSAVPVGLILAHRPLVDWTLAFLQCASFVFRPLVSLLWRNERGRFAGRPRTRFLGGANGA